jgi:hypothetical protein
MYHEGGLGAMTVQEKVEIYWPGLFGGAGMVLSIMDSLGQLGSHSPTIHLDAIVFLLGSLLTFTSITAKSMKETRDKVDDLVTQTDLDRASNLSSKLDSTLKPVFSEYFQGHFRQLRGALEHKTVKIEGKEDLAHIFGKVLEGSPRRHLKATSLPFKRYFWKDPKTLDAIKKFIQVDKGTMTRIFFLDYEDQLSDDKEVIEVLSDQVAIGVEVYTMWDVPDKLYKLFVVADDRSIAWDAAINNEQCLVSATITSHSDSASEFERVFDHLMRRSTCKRFWGSAQQPGPAP